jgi:hypothetical protein
MFRPYSVICAMGRLPTPEFAQGALLIVLAAAR